MLRIQSAGNAELNDYTPFVKPVPFVQRGQFLEQNISTPTQLRGNAVRIVSEETAALIIQKSGTTPPWSWEFPDTGGDEEIDTSPQNKLRDAIAKFDGMYASLEPEERRKLVGGLHRPSSIGNLLREFYGTHVLHLRNRGVRQTKPNSVRGGPTT